MDGSPLQKRSTLQEILTAVSPPRNDVLIFVGRKEPGKIHRVTITIWSGSYWQAALPPRNDILIFAGRKEPGKIHRVTITIWGGSHWQAALPPRKGMGISVRPEIIFTANLQLKFIYLIHCDISAS